jgi:hypothetical protein
MWEVNQICPSSSVILVVNNKYIMKNHFSKFKLQPELQFNATQLENLTECN